MFLTFASNRLLATISLSYVGSLGPTQLAAAGLATSLANVTGDSILTGIANAMQTLCGQVPPAVLTSVPARLIDGKQWNPRQKPVQLEACIDVKNNCQHGWVSRSFVQLQG